MFDNARTLMRLWGVDVRATPSLLLVAVLVGASLLQRFEADERSVVLLVAMATAGTLVFVVSILIHELAHALEAMRRGIEVGGITLWLFGGVTEMHVEARRPRDEFAVAAIGPYSSLVLAGVGGLIATYAGEVDGVGWRALGDVAGVMGWLNLLLAVFNIIPGAPLDGGRVLRAGLWALTKSRSRAMRIAARAGQGLALLLAGGGLWLYAAAGAFFDALWLGFIGWFLWNAARAELRQADLHEALGDRTVADLPVPEIPAVAADRTLADAQAVMGTGPVTEVVPVHVDDRAVGILHRRDVAEVDPADRGFVTAGAVARPLDELAEVAADEPAMTLVRRLSRAEEDDAVLVTRPGAAPTVLTRAQVARALADLEELSGRRAASVLGHDPAATRADADEHVPEA